MRGRAVMEKLTSNLQGRRWVNRSSGLQKIVFFLVMVFVGPMIAADPGFPQTIPTREFVGAINHTLRIRMKLSQADRVLTGSYSYEKARKSLRLDGRMKNEEDFYLAETDERGNQTGTFEGTFASKDWIEGVWSSADKKRSLPFSAWVLEGEQVPASTVNDKISGQYKRVVRGKLDRHAATLNVWLLKDGRVRVAGDAIWVGNARTGNVNTGDVDGIFALQGSKLFYKEADRDNPCSFTIHLGVESLRVTDDTMNCGGMNVTFDGEYRKVRKTKAP